MNVQIPFHRFAAAIADNVTWSNDSQRPQQEQPHPQAVSLMLESASCAAEDGDAPCKKVLGMKKLNGVYRTKFYFTDPSILVPSLIVQREKEGVIFSTHSLTRYGGTVLTIPQKWWLLCSPHTWFEKLSFMMDLDSKERRSK